MRRSTVTIELVGDAPVARDLAAGGVFIPGCTLRLAEECELVVCGANRRLSVPARVVYVDEQRGAGLELIGFSTQMREQLAELAELAPSAVPAHSSPAHRIAPVDSDLALPPHLDFDFAPTRTADAGDSDPALLDAGSLADADPEPGPGDAGAGDPDARRSGASVSPHIHERLRGLTLAAQIKLAISGELHERIVLERLYGKNVWEPLLRNPRLTAPEVARIARFGSLPRVLLELILGNNAWLQIPEVRRALLTNPRLGADQIMKVLRLTPKHELRLAAVQTAYPHAVRNAARMLLRD